MSNFGGSQSRLNHETKRRTLFPAEKHDKLKWTDGEMYALVLFMILHTDGKQWCAHKTTKFWDNAGIFVQLRSGSAICRSGNVLVYHLTFVTIS